MAKGLISGTFNEEIRTKRFWSCFKSGRNKYASFSCLDIGTRLLFRVFPLFKLWTTGPYIAMRMRTVTILKFHGGWAVQIDILFENYTFWRTSKRITIQIILTVICYRKNWRISKNRIIVTLFCCVLQQTWRQFGPSVWCLFVNISGHGQCGRKRKKDI